MVQNLGWFKKIIISKNLKTNDLITIFFGHKPSPIHAEYSGI